MHMKQMNMTTAFSHQSNSNSPCCRTGAAGAEPAAARAWSAAASLASRRRDALPMPDTGGALQPQHLGTAESDKPSARQRAWPIKATDT